MTPIEFLLMHREKVLAVYTGSPGEAWKKLDEQIQIHDAMKPNTFNAILKAFVETCRYYDGRIDSLKTELETVKQELNTLQGLNSELNKQLELNNQLNTSERLNMPVEQDTVKQGLNILGYSIQESRGYYRAFKKVAGKMVAVYLGKNLDDAESKIRRKELELKPV